MSEPVKFSLDGEILEPGEAFLPLPDDGLLRGDGVFEVIRLYDGKPFAFDLHLDRMGRSAEAIHLPLAREELAADVDRLLAAVPAGNRLLRIVQTRSGRRIVSLEKLPEHSPAISLASVTYSPTVILNGVKSLSYAANMQVTRLAKAAGAGEALFVRPDAIVLEAPTSTIFWATPEGRIRTPALEAGVLDSITRRKIIENLDVEQGEFPLDDLLSASEAFLASTTREVQPVDRVDGTSFGPTPGPATRKAMDAFEEALRKEMNA